ncbi:Threonine/homoserine/homoserine lactone efflux protein [Thermomonospora echinospora]|uniref:Threonine/homoserine/homoserine lactone efflux protein n=1 Tax=Thermomonospora echinospora TaxID=1992 RepID=A0A1H5TD27_9ACTN|nr:Threonine/homoserine/homoserine lactone efflux protein [Thermomonospora echinospora]
MVAVLTVTPGPDMLLVLRNGLRSGPQVAWFTGLGCCLGISCHAVAAVLGLSAVLAASATAYTVVKVAGAVYLAYLGVRMVLAAVRKDGGGPDVPVAAGVLRRGEAFRQGLLTNLLNPKIALLFLTLLPQFVGSGEPRLRTTALLALVFLAIAVAWWRLFTLALRPVSRLLRGERARRTLDGVAGVLLLGIGARVVLEPR